MLTFKRIVACTPRGEDTDVSFLGDDGRMYDARLTAEARRQLLTRLQAEVATGREAELLALTVTGQSTVVSAHGPALALSTSEIGAIACVIPRELIPRVQQSLGEILAMPDPQRRH